MSPGPGLGLESLKGKAIHFLERHDIGVAVGHPGPPPLVARFGLRGEPVPDVVGNNSERGFLGCMGWWRAYEQDQQKEDERVERFHRDCRLNLEFIGARLKWACGGREINAEGIGGSTGPRPAATGAGNGSVRPFGHGREFERQSCARTLL